MTGATTDLDPARLERAHYQLQRALYFTETVEVRGATAFFAEGISEPEWNHAAKLCAEDSAEIQTILHRIEALFEARGLAPAIELGPASRAPDPERHLRDRGYVRQYRYAWLTPDPSRIERPEAPQGVEVLEVRSQAEAEEFFNVFRTTYSDDLEPGYERALTRAGSSASGCQVVHHLARVGDHPAAVATSLHGLSGDARGATGLCNLAVDPDWRRRGLGGLLTRHRMEAARARGHRAFLQTERTYVENWQRRHGFRLAFVTEGWVRSQTPKNPESNDPTEETT